MVEYRRRPRTQGQSIVETVVGIIFLIPIVLFLFDVAVLVLASSADDNLAKSACRAAASATDASGQGTAVAAQAAADSICQNFAGANNPIIKKPGSGSFLTSCVFDTVSGQVTVTTTLTCKLPVPFPFLSNVDFVAKAVEPIVSISP